MNQAAIPQKEEKLMATATLAVTLTTPISEPRPATTDRILVIEDDRALRKILRQLFSTEGYEIDVVSDVEKSCRSEEHTSELQSHLNLVCRLLLEKKKKKMK